MFTSARRWACPQGLRLRVAASGVMTGRTDVPSAPPPPSSWLTSVSLGPLTQAFPSPVVWVCMFTCVCPCECSCLSGECVCECGYDLCGVCIYMCMCTCVYLCICVCEYDCVCAHGTVHAYVCSRPSRPACSQTDLIVPVVWGAQRGLL